MREPVVYCFLIVLVSATLCLQVYGQIKDNDFYTNFNQHRQALECPDAKRSKERCLIL